MIGAVKVSCVGIGVSWANELSPTVMTPLAGMVIRLDWPERVTPLATQVARTRIWPWPAGTLVRIQTPLASTGAVRLSALTVQVWSSWPQAVAAARKSSRKDAAAAEVKLACRRICSLIVIGPQPGRGRSNV